MIAKQVSKTMTDSHPITPPPELVCRWFDESPYRDGGKHVATQAARWGADQELEACCEWFQEFYKMESWVDLDLRTFRAARRPKPPSLKEKALLALRHLEKGAEPQMDATEAAYTIRRALEQLDD